MNYQFKPQQKVTIKSVYDGDTFLLIPQDLPKGEKASVKVRLRWVDAPETDKGVPSNNPVDQNQWAWGNKAKELILALGNEETTVNPLGLDKFNRLLVDLNTKFMGKTVNFQEHLIAQGLAVVFPTFENSHLWPQADINFLHTLLTKQFEAYQNKRGFWADPDFVLPYLYRSQKGG